MKTRLGLSVLVIALLCSVSHAQVSKDFSATGLDKPLLLDSVTCDASEANRTWTGPSKTGTGYSVGLFQIDFTKGGAATGWTVQTYISTNGQITWATLLPCDSTVDGDCVLTGDGQFKRTLSASESVPFRVDFIGALDIRLIVSCTGGDANDSFSLWGRAGAR